MTVVRGTCLSYGEGITYWPVVEILKQLLGAEPRAATRRARLRPGRGARPAGRARRGRRPDLGRGDRVGDSPAARDGGRARAARRGARRHPLGRGGLPRPRRPRRRPEPGRTDPAALHGPARVARPAPELGRRQAQRHDRPPRAARGGGCRGAGRRPARRRRPRPRASRPDPRRGRGQPALRPGDGRPRPRLAGRRDHRAADDPGAARGPARSARSNRTRRPGARDRSKGGCSIAARFRL